MIRALRGKCLSFGVTVSLAIVCSVAAHAGELFVMPYTCSAAGGQLVLTPSSDQGYSVIGRKDQRPFSACSPSNPDICKQWTVYRFDMNCGGKRVPWVDVAAAVSATRNGRAFADHGRLRIEMPPRWAMAPDDPCSREAIEGGEWHGSGFDRFCAERRENVRGPIVEIPDGFAPMMGLDAIFVADGAPGSPSGGAGPFASADPRTPPPFASEAAPSPPPQPPKAFAHPKPTSPPSTREAVDAPKLPAPKPAERSEKPAIKSPAASPPPAATTVTAPSPPPVQSAGTPTMPTVINSPNAPKISDKPADPSVAAPESPPAPPAAVPAPQPATPPKPSQVVTASIDAPANDAPKAPVTEVATPAPPVSGVGSFLTPTALAAAGLATLALVALIMIQWQNRSALQTSDTRDIATVSFEGGSPRRDLATVRHASTVSAPPATIFAPRDVGNDMPQTREQALHMLGMGVTPDGSEAAIKKIVDGLRQSWHPDLAKSEAERQLRELRTKQINAAWAIISGNVEPGGSGGAVEPRLLPPNAA